VLPLPVFGSINHGSSLLVNTEHFQHFWRPRRLRVRGIPIADPLMYIGDVHRQLTGPIPDYVSLGEVNAPAK